MTSPKKQYRVGSRCDLTKKDGPEEKNYRMYFIVVFFAFVAVNIVIRLYTLQVAAYETYKELAEGQHSLFKKLVPKRGEIFLSDRNGLYPAAVNKETKMAYAVPKEIEEPEIAALKIADVLGLDTNDLKEKFGHKDDMYEVLKHKLSDEEITRVKDLKLDGIHLAEESFRYYPAGELASHVVGFVGWSENVFGGRYGGEAYYEDILKGQEGELFQNRDTSGRWISTGVKEITHAKDGSDLVLTIDHVVQYETEKILKSAVNKHKADRGTIIVMEPGTGKILAMASYPNFNPNEYGTVENMEAFRNVAVSDAYESGSVFKSMTLAAALDDDKISPDTTYTDTGAVTEAGYTIQNSDQKANGVQTMTQVLEASLNTGVIYAEKLMGNKTFGEYVRRFGFGELTNIDLPGEAKGNIKNLENLKSNIQHFTASFGQGITVTPIQLVSAYNAIASGGTLMKPYIVDRMIHPDGTEQKTEPQEIRRVIGQKAAREISEIMRSVVVKGHGKQANVPGYAVCGKTGTAQVASSTAKGYEEGMNIGSFVGFAPLENPRFTILVRIDNPKDVAWAESSAAPTFGELMKFLLEWGNVEPQEEFTEEDLVKFDATHNLRDYYKEEKNEDGEKINEATVAGTSTPASNQAEKEKTNEDKKKKRDGR